MEDGIHRGLAAEATGGCREEVTRQAFPVALVVIDEENEGVIDLGFEIDATDLPGGGDDSLSEEKAHYEDFIVIRGSHENSERAAIDNDLQGFFNCDEIPERFGPVVVPSRHLALAD